MNVAFLDKLIFDLEPEPEETGADIGMHTLVEDLAGKLQKSPVGFNKSGDRRGMHGGLNAATGRTAQEFPGLHMPGADMTGGAPEEIFSTPAIPTEVEDVLSICVGVDPRGDTTKVVQRLQARNRALLLLIAQGYTQTQCAKIFAARGIKWGSASMSSTINSPLFVAELDRLQQKCEAKLVEETYITKDMVADSLKLLHGAVRGAVEQPVIDKDGKLVEGETVHRVVDHKDRIRSAKELLDRTPQTAPVSREMSSTNTSAASQEEWERIRAHLRGVRESLNVTATPVEPAACLPT